MNVGEERSGYLSGLPKYWNMTTDAADTAVCTTT